MKTNQSNVFVKLLGISLLGWCLTNAQASPTDKIEQAIQDLLPDAKASSIEPTQIPGLFEVSFGSSIFYFNEDASIMMKGDMIDIKNRVNLTEKKRGEARGKLLNSMNASDMIVYPAKNEKTHITVFTDIDCPYCVKLHREMVDYNNEGITVRYMAFPRAGVGSPSYDKAVSVWCADDKAKAMTDAKSKLPVAEKSCDNPVAQQMQIGQALGVRGTPAIFLEDGTSLPGYVPPKRLASIIYQN
jgi:thiol:disulfide interchange protein DsbC